MDDAIEKKGGGRECRTCKRERDRRYKKSKTQAKRKARAQTLGEPVADAPSEAVEPSDQDIIGLLYSSSVESSADYCRRLRELFATSTTPTHAPSLKSLEEMEQEVYDVNKANGWHEGERSMPEGAMLTVTEVAEAVEAFRSWGLRDMTGVVSLDKALTDPKTSQVLHKPEGVGSEYADIFIRILDQCRRDGIDLRAEYERKLAYNRLRGFRHGGKTI